MEQKRDEAKAILLDSYLEADGVAVELRPALIAEIRILVAKATRPKWADRFDFVELRRLSAPAFLRRVHADDIKDNVVNKEQIRAIDPELMTRVESYISQREGRQLDLGDATGLIFITSRPATNRREPQRTQKPATHSQADQKPEPP